MIQYTLKPVSGESDIRKAVTELIENSDEVFFARHAASGKQSILAAAALVYVHAAAYGCLLELRRRT